ncbi:replication initiation protein [Cellulosimicrobium protaetiae]|uniref:Primase C-terminal 1 domain-containing protein n=1 Tax=Cellulosimicrobium protaetiae TaxID=2587808 RepID=A0A6M5UJZ2_9MICO|nr:replication initiation protein [Cellulosimicrobium protaetiae]QJW38756.1 hypothetical protein FIC82_020445 [Cellulosimicrobium protaetiae]
MTTSAAEDATATTGEQWEQMWLPLFPYSTNDLAAGIYRRPRPIALGHRYIETNPAGMSNLLVVDVDHPDAALRALSSVGSHPLPNAIVSNPRNGHAHAIWTLAEAVTRTEYARRKPLAYAAAVTEGLRRALDGDKAYSGLMTKNPLHDSWEAEWLHTNTWDLAQLEEELGDHMPPPRWREGTKRRGEVVGLGRNCSLFESARHWAYRALRHHFGDPEGLASAIHAEVNARNVEFSEPLPASEARAIAASIHRWITMWADGEAVYGATFVAIQSARGRKGGRKSAETRQARVAARAAAILGES